MRLIRRGPLNRREIAALWLAAVMFVASPAIAHHLPVPTAPVTDIQFEVGEYPSTRVSCGDTVYFTNLRVEVSATVDAKPSEHWTTRFEVRNPRGHGQWYVLWPHQNVGPHGSLNVVQANVPLVHSGTYQVRVVVTGDESGNRIERTCLITKG
jgi:hypothetical protein